MKRRLPMKRLMICMTFAASLMGCARGFDIATPDGFAELDDQERFDYRATTAEGVVLGVRKKANEPRGDLGFWAGAVDAHLRRQGYRALEPVDVQSESGVRGRQLRYARSLGGRDHVFWVTVFVTESAVITVEAGGDQTFFAQERRSVEKAIRSLVI